MRLIHPDYMGAPAAAGVHSSSLASSSALLMHTSNDDNFHHGPLVGNRPQKNTTNSHSLGNISASVAALNGHGGTAGSLSAAPTSLLTDELLLMRKKSRSREAINLGSHGMPISGTDGKFKQPPASAPMQDSTATASNGADLIFTTARPATVIANGVTAAAATSTTTNGHQDAPNFLHIREELGNGAAVRQSTRRAPLDYANHMYKNRKDLGLGPASTNNNEAVAVAPSMAGGLLMPSLPASLMDVNGDTKEVDWSRLVDDAIQQVNEGLKHSAAAAAAANKSGYTTATDTEDAAGTGTASDAAQPTSTTTAGLTQSTSVPELQLQVVQLEDRVGKETRRRRSLEQAVRRLTEENRRLQDESQAAVQQLRRFTEWFFQTIDRQN